MELKAKIFRRKSGKSMGKWVVRLDYFDQVAGRNRSVERLTSRRSDAVDLRDQLLRDLRQSNGEIVKGSKMTFADLARVGEELFYMPAVLIEGRKVAGVRSIGVARSQLKTLRSFFGTRKIGSLTRESLTDYKLWRLANTAGGRSGQGIKLASVNRELAVMRKLMRYAFSEGWVLRDIFYNAKIIDSAGELERTRVLTRDEERRLLETCGGDRTIVYERTLRGKQQTVSASIHIDNPYLKVMIMLALDSGLRRGEIFKLRWQDIDFDKNLIRVVGTHTKTERERVAPLSQRTKEEIRNLVWTESTERPFPFVDIKRSFATAKRLAGIEDLHFHDLRRTAITRWIRGGTSLALAGKFAGHSQLQTTMKYYTGTDAEMAAEVSARVDAFNTHTVGDLVPATIE